MDFAHCHMSHNQNLSHWRVGTIPAINGCAFQFLKHGSGSTTLHFFVPGLIVTHIPIPLIHGLSSKFALRLPHSSQRPWLLRSAASSEGWVCWCWSRNMRLASTNHLLWFPFRGFHWFMPQITKVGGNPENGGQWRVWLLSNTSRRDSQKKRRPSHKQGAKLLTWPGPLFIWLTVLAHILTLLVFKLFFASAAMPFSLCSALLSHVECPLLAAAPIGTCRAHSTSTHQPEAEEKHQHPTRWVR